MPKRKLTCLGMVIVLLAAATAASAATVVFTDEAAFLASLQTPFYLEEFTAYSGIGAIVVPPDPPLNFGPVSGFSFDISSSKIPYKLNGAISTLEGNETLMVTGLDGTTPVTAVGGQFFPTDDPGNFTTGTIYVSFNEEDPYPITVTSTASRPFLGFLSDAPITSIDIFTNGHPQNGPYPTLDHFYVATQVPIPSSFLLLGTGLLGLGAVGWRRRKPS